MTETSDHPLYDPTRVDAAYQLRYSWTGWPSAENFPSTEPELLQDIRPLWERDGLRLLEHCWSTDQIQLLFSAKPAVSPTFLAGRAKGRLDHALRAAGSPIDFSRKIAVRSVGDNTRTDVESYVERQVGKERFIDPQYEQLMREFTVVRREVDLSLPAASARGRYWYNLHVVLVVEDRYRLSDREYLATIRDICFKIAEKKSYTISRLSAMPNHLHLALRGAPEQSPNDIVYAFQNNLAYALGQKPLWKNSFYVGTFGEYRMDGVRRKKMVTSL